MSRKTYTSQQLHAHRLYMNKVQNEYEVIPTAFLCPHGCWLHVRGTICYRQKTLLIECKEHGQFKRPLKRIVKPGPANES